MGVPSIEGNQFLLKRDLSIEQNNNTTIRDMRRLYPEIRILDTNNDGKFNKGDKTQIESIGKMHKNIFINRMEDTFKIPENCNILPSISIHTDSSGHQYLKIARPKNDSDDNAKIYNYKKLKDVFKLNDGSLLKVNSDNGHNARGLLISSDKTEHPSKITPEYLDSLNIGKGHFLYISLDNIGQKDYISEESKELREITKTYLDNCFR